MEFADIRGVCFDLGGTVIRTHSGPATRRIADLLDVDFADMRRFLSVHGKRTRCRTGELAQRLCAEYVKPDMVEPAERLLKRMRDETERAPWFDEAEPVLRTLRARGYPIAFLSNVLGAIASREPGRLADFADVVLFSCDIHCMKPELRAFELTAERLGQPPASLLHVGDSLTADVIGARDAGWHAVHLDRGEADRPAVPDSDGPSGRIRIRDLTELLTLLPARPHTASTSATDTASRNDHMTRTSTAAPARSWLTNARTDPITGLVAFPDFHAGFPDHLATALEAGHHVGLAIGDVDNLKDHVEHSNDSDPTSFGHLAGYALMAELGSQARTWFNALPTVQGCVSTFGGDEIIIALRLDRDDDFVGIIGLLRDALRSALPRSVSFAAIELSPAHARAADTDHSQLLQQALSNVDRLLFRSKARNRELGRALDGFIATDELAGPLADPVVCGMTDVGT